MLCCTERNRREVKSSLGDQHLKGSPAQQNNPPKQRNQLRFDSTSQNSIQIHPLNCTCPARGKQMRYKILETAWKSQISPCAFPLGLMKNEQNEWKFKNKQKKRKKEESDLFYCRSSKTLSILGKSVTRNPPHLQLSAQAPQCQPYCKTPHVNLKM